MQVEPGRRRKICTKKTKGAHSGRPPGTSSALKLPRSSQVIRWAEGTSDPTRGNPLVATPNSRAHPHHRPPFPRVYLVVDSGPSCSLRRVQRITDREPLARLPPTETSDSLSSTNATGRTSIVQETLRESSQSALARTHPTAYLLLPPINTETRSGVTVGASSEQTLSRDRRAPSAGQTSSDL